MTKNIKNLPGSKFIFSTSVAVFTKTLTDRVYLYMKKSENIRNLAWLTFFLIPISLPLFILAFIIELFEKENN